MNSTTETDPAKRLAREHGLHSCAQEAWAMWHKTVAEFFAMPPELMLFAGMALGHADPDAIENTLATERAAMEVI